MIQALELGGGTEKKKKEKKEKKEEKEKVSHMCESIGHRPLRGRCPKAGAVMQKMPKNAKKARKEGRKVVKEARKNWHFLKI